MSDDDAFFSHLRELRGQHESSGDPSQSTFGRLAGATEATVEGMGKGIANLSGNLPTLVGLPALHSKWASSTNKDYPVAEAAGRYLPELGGLAALPEAGVGEAATELVPELAKVPRVAKAVGKVGEGLWKGYAGGAAEGDPKTGEEAGAGSAAVWEGLKAIPNKGYLLGPAMLMAYEASKGGYMPWDMRHALSYFAEAAAAMTGKFPGVAGAMGAKAFGGGQPAPQQRAPWDQGNGEGK
jgi:hypothetical protein